MKIVIGIDDLEHLKVIGGVVNGLRIAKPQIELAHVLERLAEVGTPGLKDMPADLIERHLRMQEEEANNLLAQGQQQLEQQGLASDKKLLAGFSANRVVAYAQETGADLLAVGSSGKGRAQGVIIGSVGRKALISANCSVLVAKKAVDTKKPLTVVFATDHSAYANRCMEKFLAWQPTGIGRAVVVTVYPEQLIQTLSAVMRNFKADVSAWVRDELQGSNRQLIQKLSLLGSDCKSRVESGVVVGDVLEKVMQEEEADLLVLGAQGHGFVERMTIGSVSLDQALRRRYSVLVLRA